MTTKYKSGNTKVMIDLGKLYDPLASYALEVGSPLATIIKLILRDALTDGHTITLPPFSRGVLFAEVQDLAKEDGQPGVD